MAASAISAGNKSERASFAWGPAIVALICLEVLVALQAFFAYEDRFFSVAQMQGRGINQGLPFFWHFGMWGDFFVISPLAAFLVGRYITRWWRRWLVVSLAIGFISAGAMSFLYTFSGIPEAHVQNHHLTLTGQVHLVYMAIAIAVFIQFLFFTENVSARLLGIVSVLLFIHVFVGTHMALGIIKLICPLDWYPAHPLESVFGWITVCAIGFGLAWRTFGLGRVLYPPNRHTKTAEQYLVFLDDVCKVVSAGYFISRFIWALVEAKVSMR